MIIDYSKFDWGWMNHPVERFENGQQEFLWHIHEDGSVEHMSEYHKKGMIYEIFENRCYEKYFEVEKGDIVVDIGASVGPFTFSILGKKPKHVFCLEPSEKEIETLVRNTIGNPVTVINKGISYQNSVIETDMMFGGEKQMESITFEKFINLYGLTKIDFLKTDCEGSEYYIFTEKNLDYIKSNVRKISGEWHLSTEKEKNDFRNFRDYFLIQFEKFEVNSLDGIDIKWDLWNDHFIEYYNQIHLFIDNRR